jgi:hypothetical protein
LGQFIGDSFLIIVDTQEQNQGGYLGGMRFDGVLDFIFEFFGLLDHPYSKDTCQQLHFVFIIIAWITILVEFVL